jgi:hypothetical protein
MIGALVHAEPTGPRLSDAPRAHTAAAPDEIDIVPVRPPRPMTAAAAPHQRAAHVGDISVATLSISSSAHPPSVITTARPRTRKRRSRGAKRSSRAQRVAVATASGVPVARIMLGESQWADVDHGAVTISGLEGVVARCDRDAFGTMLAQVVSGTLEGIRLPNSSAGADVFLVRNGRGVRIARVGTEAVFAAVSGAQVQALLEACSGRPLHVVVTQELLTELADALGESVDHHDELSPYAEQCLVSLPGVAIGTTLPPELYWALNLYEIEAPSTDGHYTYDGHTGSWTG